MRRWWRRLKFVVRVTVRTAGFFPEPGLPRPIRFRSRTHRDPDLDPDLGGLGAPPARSGCAAGRTRRARWPRVDGGVLDRVPLALERDMRLGPQRVHDLDLLL